MVFFHKKFRPGQTKTVDTLLYIAHHEHIGNALPPAYAVQNNLLDQVTVLIFVNHNLCVPGGQLPRRSRRYRPQPSIFIGLHVLHQNLQSQVLQIWKIRQIFQTLLLLIAIREFCRQGQQHLRSRRRPLYYLQNVCKRHRNIFLLQLLQAFLHTVPECLDLLFSLLLHCRILLRGQSRERKPTKPLPKLLITFAVLQLLHLYQIRLQRILIHIRPARQTADGQHPL